MRGRTEGVFNRIQNRNCPGCSSEYQNREYYSVEHWLEGGAGKLAQRDDAAPNRSKRRRTISLCSIGFHFPRLRLLLLVRLSLAWPSLLCIHLVI